MAWWDVMLMVICLVVCGLAAVFAVFAVVSATAGVRAYSQDARIWRRLRVSGLPAEATVVRLSRHPRLLTKAGSHGNQVAAAELAVMFADESGTTRDVVISTFIETALLSRFVEGTLVPIVYAAKDPQIVALDRDRVQLEIPVSIDAR